MKNAGMQDNSLMIAPGPFIPYTISQYVLRVAPSRGEPTHRAGWADPTSSATPKKWAANSRQSRYSRHPTCWRALQVHGSLLTRVQSPLISARVVGITVLSLGTTEPTEHGSSYTPAHAICRSKTGLLRCGTTRQSIAWTGCPREGATGLWDVSQRVSCFVPGLTWFSLRCSRKESWTLLWSRVVEKPVFGSTGTLFIRYVCMHGFRIAHEHILLLSLHTYKLFNRKSLQKLDMISPKYMLLLNSGSYYWEIPGQQPQTTASVCLKCKEISKQHEMPHGVLLWDSKTYEILVIKAALKRKLHIKYSP